MKKISKYGIIFSVLAIMPFIASAEESANSDYAGAYDACEEKADKAHGNDTETVYNDFIKKCMKDAGFDISSEEGEDSSASE